jgi:hypothetical protein
MRRRAEAVGDMYELVFLRNMALLGDCSADDDLVGVEFFCDVVAFGACSVGWAFVRGVPEPAVPSAMTAC